MSSEPILPEPSWQRLDKRMLLVHPVTELVKFIPVLIGTVLLGTSSGNHLWSLVPLTLIVLFALTRWFTTSYRVGPADVELRTGLIQRKRLSVPRSRIRSVDIEADLLRRALGLAVVVIGTGKTADREDKFKLDALDARVVPGLRVDLLAHTARSTAAQPVTAEPPRSQREIGYWQPNWARYAPLSLTGFAVVAPPVGLAFQYGLGRVLFKSQAAQRLEDGSVAVLILAALALLAAIVLIVSLAACARYLSTYHGLKILADGRTLHLRHGLFTTRQITMDLARFRGATVKEPLLLRLAGAAELEAIMVGEKPKLKLLPQAPRAAVERTLAELLAPRPGPAGAENAAPQADSAGPRSTAQGTAPLISHGPVARRRRYTRALTPAFLAVVVLLAASVAGVHFSHWWWLPTGLLALAGAALAEDRYRGLGHTVIPATATAPTWLITRSGSLDRARDCLEAPGIIGWTVRQTFWQRRSGVATVIAAAAAGKKRYPVIDIPVDQAWPLIEAVTPGRLGPRVADR